MIPTILYDTLSHIPILVKLKKQGDRLERLIWRCKHVCTKWKRRSTLHPISHSYRFCILCVKRIEYVDMAIDQINSLHYYNPYHVFDILCDRKCMTYMQTRLYGLDYPANTLLVPFVEKISGPWQQYKIQALLYAIKRDGVLVDADMFWYTDPLVRQWQALFFSKAYHFKDQSAEQLLVSEVFEHAEWGEYPHFTTGIMYLPYCLYSKQLKNTLLHFSRKLLNHPYTFLENEEQRNNLRRLSDELAINLAFQTNLNERQITTLKEKDSPGDRRVVLSLYYGSMNRIMS